MCSKGSHSGTGTSSGAKSSMTCNSCGGLGHFARNCPSKVRQAVSGPSAKINIAVAKITTRDEYKKYLAETQKQVGNRTSCGQPAHFYTRKFPFGTGDWPSTRLDSCPQFVAKSARERGELVERLKACYKCTNWKHQGDSCFMKNKSNCTVVTSGTACAGTHHKLLHGSGIAFCHKIHVKVASAASIVELPDADNMSRLPDLGQPVLLEVQKIKVHGQDSKVMFDKGSTAALMTHAFAEQAGLKGKEVAYWLVVVGHESILRHTLLYTFFIMDNQGTRHELQAFGIDQISDDTTAVDLNKVMSVFPGAPREVFARPEGPIDILIGSMYMNVQPFGGEDEFTRGRLWLV